MKARKIISVLLSALMILSSFGFTVFADGAVSDQTALDTAVGAAVVGVPTVIELADGTYEFPRVAMANKDITFKGSADVIIDFEYVQINSFNNIAGATLKFDGVTVKWAKQNDSHQGCKDAKKVVYKDCTIIGTQFMYGDADFIGCTFESGKNSNGSDYNGYNVFGRGIGKLNFIDCVFNTGGRAVMLYNDHATNVKATLVRCTFTDNGAYTSKPKAAVETGDDPGDGSQFSIILKDCVANGFEENGSDSPLWGNKDSMPSDRLKVLINPPLVAIVDGMEYFDLKEVLELVKTKTGDVVVKLEDNLTLSDFVTADMSGTQCTTLTIDGNGKTITGLAQPLFTNIGAASLTVKNLTFKDSAVVGNVSSGMTGAGVITAGTANTIITIDNVTVDGGTITSDDYAGAFVGYHQIHGNDKNITIKNSAVKNLTLISNDDGSIGALVGHIGPHNGSKVTAENTTVSNITITQNSARPDKAGILFGTAQSDVEMDVTVTGTNTANGSALTKLIGRMDPIDATLKGGTYPFNPTIVGTDDTSYAEIVPVSGEIEVTVDGLLVENPDGTFTVIPNEYITFDANSGSGTMEQAKGLNGESFNLPANTFTKANCIFGSWNTKADGTGTAYADEASITLEEDITLYAQWKAIINFDANGGAGDAKTQYVAENDNTTALDANTYTREHYTFTGWNTETDGSGTAYAADAKAYTVPAGTTLYAQWAKNEYTLTFENTGDTTIAPITEEHGEAISVTEPAKTGYTFSGWLLGDVTVAQADMPTAMPTENRTYVAQWTPITYTIKFNSNGGEGTMADLTVTYDVATPLPANTFTCTDSYFNGWNTAADGTGTGYADGTEVMNLTDVSGGEITLYAIWSALPPFTPATEMAAQTYDYDGTTKSFVMDAADEGYSISYIQDQEKANPINAGVYDVRIFKVGTAENAAYDTTIPSGLVINKAPLTVTADDKNIYVGDALPTFTYTLAGTLYNNNTFTDIVVNSAEADVNTAGSYAITASGGTLTNSANYEVTYVPGTLVVSNRPSTGVAAPTNNILVKFETNGGSAIDTIRVNKNSVIREPKAPTKSGYTFAGWYTDESLTEAYDFSTGLTNSITLYAKWEVDEAQGGSTGGSGSTGSTGSTGGTGSVGGTVTTPGASYTDVEADSWYAEYVELISELGLMNGVSDTDFAPNSLLTRGMLATIIYRYAEGKATDAEIDFNDISGHWASDAVKWAVSAGIVNGYDNGAFGVDDNITREQIAVMLYRYAGSPEAAGDISIFTDADSISGYAEKAIKWAVEMGIINGKGNDILDPKGNATRAEAAKMISVFVELAK